MLVSTLPYILSTIPLTSALAAVATVTALLTIVFLYYQQVKRHRLARRLAELERTWGEELHKGRDFDLLAAFHSICPPTADAAESIDDHTWNDLNLQTLYTAVDRTMTTAGECLLYRILRSAIVSDEALDKRRRFIRLFQTDADVRRTLQSKLLIAGTDRPQELIRLIWRDPPTPFASAWLFRGLTAMALFSLIGAFLWGGMWVLSTLFMFCANMYVHYHVRNRSMGYLGALRQLRMLIIAARHIAQIRHPDFADYSAALHPVVSVAQPIAKKVALLLPEGSTSGDLIAMLLEYVSIFFLQEVRAYHAALTDIIAHSESLKTLFLLVGELDAWQSVASFRAGLPQYVEPQFSDDFPAINVRDARHPLVPDCVPNSIEISTHGIAITGSNMSGKTTFLKTVAVNALLGQTICTCFASSYQGIKLRIISSMNETDDLLEGKSYYLAEAERLLEIVRKSESRKPMLVLIDEPLAGTNSPERLAASREILSYLSQHNSQVMASTHDVELVSQLQAKGQFGVFHFADLATDQGVRFDYQLRRGLDYHGNAIRVLKHLGYPDAIINGALQAFSNHPASVKDTPVPNESA